MPRKLSERDQSLWICEHTLAGAVPGRAAAPSDSRAQGPGHFNKGRGFSSDEASREGSLPLHVGLRSWQGIVLVSVWGLHSLPLGVGPVCLKLAKVWQRQHQFREPAILTLPT